MGAVQAMAPKTPLRQIRETVACTPGELRPGEELPRGGHRRRNLLADALVQQPQVGPHGCKQTGSSGHGSFDT